MSQIIQKLLQKLSHNKIDYFLIPNSDQFLNEYLPDFEKRIEFLSNFDGSNAFIILNQKQSYFFTDSRYLIAAKQQIDNKIFQIIDIAQQNPNQFLLQNCQNQSIAYDPKLHSAKLIQYLLYNKLNLQSIYNFFDQNPIDQIWQDRNIKQNKIFLHQEQFTGQNWQEKTEKIYNKLHQDCDGIFITAPESCSYLFNIRCFIIDYVPTCPSYILISKNRDILLFLDDKNLTQEVKDKLKSVQITNFDNLSQKISDFCHKNQIKNIQIDLNQSNYHILQILEQQKLNIIDQIDPVILQKAIKNKDEINGMKKSHKKDGIAVTKFLNWIKNHPNKAEISEITAAEKLLNFRKEDPDFICPSFETISGFAENGAIIHYKVTKKSNKYFDKNSLYLVDSGGQYQYGTTDITRTIAIGQPTKQQKTDFTLVLKGHIALACAKFPIGTRADQLDILARQFLWQEGKNYGHGTGHGVGYFLNVHEGPCAISPKYNQIPLQEGMILSNEPGFYIENQYGIRIENLILVKKSKMDGFLEFETITQAPIDLNLINFDLLESKERDWLDNYHQKLYW
ncbi:M24 family metallopeptidase [Rickettsiales bacterium]|nr:M24 family metallopeptidase [Rickettsiales bacterium]